MDKNYFKYTKDNRKMLITLNVQGACPPTAPWVNQMHSHRIQMWSESPNTGLAHSYTENNIIFIAMLQSYLCTNYFNKCLYKSFLKIHCHKFIAT